MLFYINVNDISVVVKNKHLLNNFGIIVSGNCKADIDTLQNTTLCKIHRDKKSSITVYFTNVYYYYYFFAFALPYCIS